MNISKYIQSILNELQQHESELNELDQAIGDGDHGSNVVRGFKAVLDQSSQCNDTTPIDKDMMIAAQQLMSKIGGSSGPLLGSAFMAISGSLKGKYTFSGDDISLALKAAFDKISLLGKSKVGEATMLDALSPAIDAIKGTQPNFAAAYEAAQKGADSTIPMLATKGRASYLGERSIGHKDPGAQSIALIFKGLSEVKGGTTAVVQPVSETAKTSTVTVSHDLKPISKLVNILIISHSNPLAKATIQFISEMKNGDFTLDYEAGIENGTKFGSDPLVIQKKMEDLTVDSELLVIYDLGSSKMNTEVAYNALNPEVKARVQIVSCAFVEGSLIAVVSNTTKSATELKNIVESQAKMIK
jgi:dihydroxyacetone kinase-like protein